MKAATIFNRMRALVSDQDKQVATDRKLLPMLNQAIDDVTAEVSSMDVGLDEELVLLPNVAAGTHDLSAFQAANQPLERMFVPLAMEWKVAGDPDENYRPVDLKDQVQDIANLDVVSAWEWLGGTIHMNPCTIAVDLRIRAQMFPVELTSEGDSIVNGVTFVLTYKLAHLFGISRGNPTYIKEYGTLYDRAVDNVEEKYVKSTQSIVRRTGRTMRGGRQGNRGRMPRF